MSSNEIEAMDYEIILCYKRNNCDVDLLNDLNETISNVLGCDRRSISIGDIGYAVFSTVQSALLPHFDFVAWYQKSREAKLKSFVNNFDLAENINSHIGGTEIDLHTIRYLVSLYEQIRWVDPDRIPGLREYFNTKMDKEFEDMPKKKENGTHLCERTP